MLVISHLDRDHVSGIRILMNKLEIKRVVMPFLTTEERVLLALQYKNHNYPDTDLLTLILDPASFFRGNANLELIFVSPTTPRLDNIQDQFRDRRPPVSGNFDSGAFNITIPENIGPISEGKEIDCKNPIQVSLGNTPIMEFLFYRNNTRGDYKIYYHDLCEAIRLEIEDKKIAIDDLVAYLQSPEALVGVKQIIDSAAKLLKGLPNKSNLNMAIKKVHNSFAMPMLHRCLLNDTVERGEGKSYLNRVTEGITEKSKTINWYSELWGYASLGSVFPLQLYSPDTMLTSDISLHDAEDVQAFILHYAHVWGSFNRFQVPHHGSYLSSSYDLFRRIPLLVSFFVNYGKNNYDHPSDTVTAMFGGRKVHHITDKGRTTLEVTTQITQRVW